MYTSRQPRHYWFSPTTHSVKSDLTFERDATELAIIGLLKALKELRA